MIARWRPELTRWYTCSHGHATCSRLNDFIKTCPAVLPWPETSESGVCGQMAHGPFIHLWDLTEEPGDAS